MPENIPNQMLSPLSDEEVAEFEAEQREWFGYDPQMVDVGPLPDFCLRLVATIRDLELRLSLAEHDAIYPGDES